MIPPTPSTTVAADSTAETLLRHGKPFVEFPRFSILDIPRERDYDSNPVSFSEWLTKHLQIGKPFVIRDFDKLSTWPRAPADSNPRSGAVPSFTIERLIELSTKKNIPIRNCSTGRDLSFTFSKFVESARQSYPEFQNLYARDLHCPQEWLEQCRELLPTEVQWGGRLDLFQWLPPCARSEVMMAYVGSEGSCSGFHRCFSSTIALNFLIDTEDDRPVVCIGTDFESQQKYDAFMSSKGVSPHLDWHNLSTEEMLQADFPLYVYDQKVGDLVILPPATAHQIWNPSVLSTKLVWNILHPLSLEVGIHHVQPPFNRLCHPDVARTNLSLAYAMLSLVQQPLEGALPMPLPPDLPLLSRLFRHMVHDEAIDSQPATQITLVQLPSGVIATCNFCSTAIWNRHVRCTICADFDLCLPCYLNGRSCEHAQSYAWAELVTPETNNRVLTRAREILGFQLEEPRLPDRCKTLGTAVNDLMRAKESQASKLCHLCRIDHPEWKGQRCDTCTAFFCYRGLYRHFDIQPGDVLRHSGLWTCPKCDETCNCRCCHFANAYVKSEKPSSKRRVKASDTRGKVMGFADNVFDQKRGGKRESGLNGPMTVAHLAGKKRTVESNGQEGPSAPHRKINPITPEPDYSNRIYLSRETSEFGAGASHYTASTLPPILPSVKTVTDIDGLSATGDDRHNHITPLTSSFSMNGSANTLAPLMAASIYGSPYEQKPPYNPDQKNVAPCSRTPRQTSSSFLNTVTTSNQSHVSRAPLPQQTHIPKNTQVDQPFQNGHGRGPPHIPRPDPAIMTPLTESPPASNNLLDENIKKLEQQIQTLKNYDDEFVEMKLEDSRRMLGKEIRELEVQLEARRKEKGFGLIERLRREGFASLAEAVGLEVGVGEQAAARVGLGLGIEEGGLGG
ncbi:hypothetical protein LTR70_001416 [Exophiala xenobiotica]|uniref:JmjC domain-containing protein n=1 Tax=Lithohypha guttulata TaxID=1690604 RepID=A0ABR0KP03_9EURO|nr:hypothetical protein LTR24_000830 [Lithohypha guttulata]KAK5328095.1 hypothetical protein LTR70_001416 [Exophiala xenobiotica]